MEWGNTLLALEELVRGYLDEGIKDNSVEISVHRIMKGDERFFKIVCRVEEVHG